MSKEDEDAGHSEFVEKRRAALERYLNRTAGHPNLRVDPDFRSASFGFVLIISGICLKPIVGQGIPGAGRRAAQVQPDGGAVGEERDEVHQQGDHQAHLAA